VHPASTEGREAARRRRDRVEELLREGPRSVKALAVELSEDVKRIRRTLQALGDEDRAMATLEYAFDWPGAEPGKGRSSVVWSLKGFEERDVADVLADAAALCARVDDRLAGDDGDDLGRSPVVVGPVEVAGVVEHLGVVQDLVRDEPEQEEEEVQDLVVPDVPAREQVQDLVEPGAARRLLERCAESRRSHAALAQEVAALAAEMVEAAEGELPEGLLRARYLAALLRRIEEGDTTAGMLDRFERVAGLHAGR
jgi:hypothetical protein